GMYKAAKAREKQSSAAYAADMNSTALKIRENYWEAAWFEAKLRVDTDYVKTKEWSTANMKVRFTEGKAPRADYLRDEAELSRARAQVNEDYKDYNVALVKLKTSMGANYSSMLSLKDSLEFVEIFGDLNSFLVSAANNRQEIKQAESRVAELKAQRTVARSKYAPQV
ncbi:TolC family protein, partial [Cutibacterium acnes]